MTLVKSDGDDDRPYVCRGCQAGFDVQHHVCPCCGGYSVELPTERL